MNILKRFLLILFGFFFLMFLFSLLLPSSVKVERKVSIESTSELVFKQINELKNWSNWVQWAKKDSTIFLMLSSYSVPSEGVGASFNWNSENDEIGEGSIKISKSQPFEAIELAMDFGVGVTLSYWNFQQKDNMVEVTWGVNVDLGFNPISKWYGLFMEKDIAKDLEGGLHNLKAYTENLPRISSNIVKAQFIDKPQWCLSIRDTVDGSEIGTIHSKLFSEISLFMEKNSISDNLAPLAIYHSWSDTLVDIEAGILLKDSIGVFNNRIRLKKIDVGNVVVASHFGDYNRMPETYFSINEWMRINAVQVIGPPWEVYIVDPSIEENPNKWVTEIYFPIK